MCMIHEAELAYDVGRDSLHKIIPITVPHYITTSCYVVRIILLNYIHGFDGLFPIKMASS